MAAVALFPPGLMVDCASTDPDLLGEQAPLWGLKQVQLGAGRFRGSIRGVHSARVQLGRTSRNLGMAILGSIPANSVVLGCIVRQTGDFLVRGAKVLEHQLIKLTPEHDIDCRALGSSEIMTVAMDAAMFQQAVESILGPAADSPTPLNLANRRSRARLSRKLQALLQCLMVNPSLLQDMSVAGAWEYQVLDVCLADVSGAAITEPLCIRRQAARTAEHMMMSVTDRAISIVELCLAARVAKRTLMLGFQETYGMSPHHYHRRVRLDHARKQLHADSSLTVAQVAVRCGFHHLGRFAAYYRTQFGETPRASRR